MVSRLEHFYLRTSVTAPSRGSWICIAMAFSSCRVFVVLRFFLSRLLSFVHVDDEKYMCGKGGLSWNVCLGGKLDAGTCRLGWCVHVCFEGVGNVNMCH
jgi:hypothetical protein